MKPVVFLLFVYLLSGIVLKSETWTDRWGNSLFFGSLVRTLPSIHAPIRRAVQAVEKEGLKGFEVIFISSDRNATDMRKYMLQAQMPWPALT